MNAADAAFASATLRQPRLIRTIRLGMARLASLPSVDRRELFRAAVVLISARLALWLLPFRTMRPLTSALAGVKPGRKNMTEIQAMICVAWAVAVAGRLVPAATCLVRAMAAQILLARHGVESTLRLGATRAGSGEFRAHAWLECRGQVVVGGAESPGVYSTLREARNPKHEVN